MTREIPLTKDKIVLVDDEDYERVSQHSWCAIKIRKKFYAVSMINSQQVYLHVFLVSPPPGMEVDHVDSDGLNCQRYNMRLATHSQNMMNQKKHSDNTTGFKGVSKHRGKYRATIGENGVYHHVGYFPTAEEAAHAYDAAARQYHGEFASLNFPDETT